MFHGIHFSTDITNLRNFYVPLLAVMFYLKETLPTYFAVEFKCVLTIKNIYRKEPRSYMQIIVNLCL